jgi:hypothetical protein
MKQAIRVALVGAALVGAGAGAWSCGSEEKTGEMPALLKERYEAEMRTILRDVKMAEEQAAALEDRYVDLDALQARYLNRPVPESYRLSLSDVSANGFRAELEHTASGLRCRLIVTPSPSEGGAAGLGSGVPDCR